MNQRPSTPEEWTIHAINIHGYFFERWCRHKIEEQKGWSVTSSNYPVAYPPGERGTESALDLRADYGNRHCGDMTLLLECKKNNPDFTEWVFFPKCKSDAVGSSNQILLPVVVTHKASFNNDQLLNIDLCFGYPDFKTPLTEEGRETKGYYNSEAVKDKNKTKTANSAIQEAARQIAVARQSVIAEEIDLLTRRGKNSNWTPLRHNHIFISAIITTAKLFTCDFDAADVDALSGEIVFDKAILKEEPFLIYEWPVPRQLQDRERMPWVRDVHPNQIPEVTKMHIFVVNSEALTDFLDVLVRQQEWIAMSVRTSGR